MAEAPSLPTDGDELSFKTFWKKAAKKAFPKQLTVIQHDPKAKSAGPSIPDEDLDPDPEEENDGKDTRSKRRQQTAQAQKLHRQRKAEYTKHLEEELAHIRRLDTSAREEKLRLAAENENIRRLLEARGVGVLGEQEQTHFDQFPLLKPALATIRFDDIIGGERIFLEADSGYLSWSSPSQAEQFSSGGTSPAVFDMASTPLPQLNMELLPDDVPSVQAQPTVAPSTHEDVLVVLDFILALEYPCKDHIPPHHHDPSPSPLDANGHLLTLSSAVFTYAPPTTSLAQNSNWQVPYAEIEKLLHFSNALCLSGELTPVQAWQKLKQNVRGDVLEKKMEEIKRALAGAVSCRGFGAVMDEEVFWDVAQNVFGDAIGVPVQSTTKLASTSFWRW